MTTAMATAMATSATATSNATTGNATTNVTNTTATTATTNATATATGRLCLTRTSLKNDDFFSSQAKHKLNIIQMFKHFLGGVLVRVNG